MATKSLTVVRPGRYGTRMLKAGDTFEANGRDALLFTKLGWMTEGATPAAKAPAKPKAAPRKRKAAAKKK